MRGKRDETKVSLDIGVSTQPDKINNMHPWTISNLSVRKPLNICTQLTFAIILFPLFQLNGRP